MKINEIYTDCYLIKQPLNWIIQKNLVKLYLLYQNYFYQPTLSSGSKMSLNMFCLGKHWNPVDYKYYDNRSDVDGLIVPKMHPYLSNLATPFVKNLFPYHSTDWDICIINYYNDIAKLGLHVDNSESKESLAYGHPVVSFSIGASAIFQIGGFTRNSETQNVILDSGDILIFGGESRLRFHGISKIIKREKNPFSYFLNNGRINFTLRKY